MVNLDSITLPIHTKEKFQTPTISKLIIVKLDPITLPIYTKGKFQAQSQMLVHNRKKDISFISMSFLSNDFKIYI